MCHYGDNVLLLVSSFVYMIPLSPSIPAASTKDTMITSNKETGHGTLIVL